MGNFPARKATHLGEGNSRMKRLLMTLPLVLAPALPAQTASAPSDHELIQQLLRQVGELQAEVQRLKEAATGVPAPAPSRPAQEAATGVPAPAPSTPAQAAVSPAAAAEMETSGLPGMHFQGFSDIQFHTSDLPGSHSTFLLGQFNLFITSKISNQFSMLSEIVAEADTDNKMGIDLERLLFQYKPNDYFNLSVGRYHTAIGFYNTAYHHATWLQTSVDRPFLFAFEDGGGILPIHNVGLSATGRIPSGKLGLHYTAEMGNGRTSRSPLDEPVQNVQDENNGKAVNFAVYARPDWVRGFQAGFSIYRDRLYPEGLPAVGQTIMAAHAIYQPPRFEFLNEMVVLRHALPSGNVYHIPAFYSQLSVLFGKVRPYVRYEYMNVPQNDPMFSDVGLRHGPTAGLRFNFNEFAAFKLEYNRLQQRQLPEINGLRSQVTFAF